MALQEGRDVRSKIRHEIREVVLTQRNYIANGQLLIEITRDESVNEGLSVLAQGPEDKELFKLIQNYYKFLYVRSQKVADEAQEIMQAELGEQLWRRTVSN